MGERERERERGRAPVCTVFLCKEPLAHKTGGNRKLGLALSAPLQIDV